MHAKIKSLISGMLYFLLAILLTLAIFWGIWTYVIKSDNSADLAMSEPAQDAVAQTIPTDKGTSNPTPAAVDPAPTQAGTKAPASSVTASEPSAAPESIPNNLEEPSVISEDAIKLQGPQAGTAVLPPSRNVTPGFESSPFSQTQALKREEGSPLPPPPKRKKLPPFFRKVAILSGTQMRADLKSGVVSLELAHITGPAKDRDCIMFGQKAPCRILAKTALQRFLRGRGISCELSEAQQQAYQNRTEGATSLSSRCVIGRITQQSQRRKIKLPDLAEWMVRYGWAVPNEGHYSSAFEEAKRNKRGIHADQSNLPVAKDRRLSGETRSQLDLLAQDAVQAGDGEPASLDLIAPDPASSNFTDQEPNISPSPAN